MKGLNSSGKLVIPILGLFLSGLMVASVDANDWGKSFAAKLRNHMQNVFKRVTKDDSDLSTTTDAAYFDNTQTEGLTSIEAHPCRRSCKVGEKKTCYYKMTVTYEQWAGPHCDRCRYNESTCAEDKCIYADGVSNAMMAVNGMNPGTAAELCEGDHVVVDVLNRLREPTTIHWHGIHMSETPEMDGAPFVTQYPSRPGELFRYSFRVDRSGTLFYHSHVGVQRALGVAGAFIVRQPKKLDRQAHLYDYDLSEHIWMIHDIPYNGTFDRARNILLNGKGRSHETPEPDTDRQHRYERVLVAPGKRYRMRVIYNGVFSCPIEVSVDYHKLLIISVDGNDIEPTWGHSFTLTSGERLDFVLHANQESCVYWIRIKGYDGCAASGMYQRAKLVYRGQSACAQSDNENDNENEQPKAFKEIPDDQKKVVNAFMELVDPRNEATSGNPKAQVDNEDYTFNLQTNALRSLNPLPWPAYTEFQTFYSTFDTRKWQNETLQQIEHISYTSPVVSLLQARELFDEEATYSNRSSWPEGVCSTDKCSGTHVIRMPLNQPIEMVVGNSMNFSHPYHIHGYTVRLVGQEILDNPDDLTRLPELDRQGKLKRNRVDFPSSEKDTVQVPGRGYIIVRFISDNPGFWLYHCHIEMHALRGMLAVLKIGEYSDMKEILPRNNCDV